MKFKQIAAWSLTWAATLLTATAFAAGEAISINFASADGSVSDQTGLIGLYPIDASKWLDTIDYGVQGNNPTGLSTLLLKDQHGQTYPNAKLYLCAQGNWRNGNTDTPTARLLRGYLDDQLSSGRAAGIKIENVPFANYKVYLYFNLDNSENVQNCFPAYSVNDTFYAGNTAQNGTETVSANRGWGTIRKSSVAEGVNTLVIPNLTSPTLVIRNSIYMPGGGTAGSTRGCIAAIQIVNESLTWQGDASGAGTWNTTPANTPWIFLGAPAPFASGESVTFPTLAAAPSAAVTVSETVFPGAVQIASASTDYTFSGSGGIQSADAFIKSGSGTATFNIPLLSPAFLLNAGTLAFNIPAGETRILASTLSGAGAFTLTGPGALSLTGHAGALTGPFTVTNAAVGGIPSWDALPRNIALDPASTLAFTLSGTTNLTVARTVTGSGLLHITPTYNDGAAPAINAANFTGTIRLTPPPPGTADKAKLLNANLTLNPETTLLIDPGAELFLNNSTTLAHAKIRLSGYGNPEYLGAIRMSNHTIGGTLTLLGDTSISPGGTLNSPATINSAISVDPSLTGPVTLFFGRPSNPTGSAGIGNIDKSPITLNGPLSGTGQAPLNITVNVQNETFKDSFAHMGNLVVTNALNTATAAATFNTTNAITFADVVNETAITLSGTTRFTATGTLAGPAAGTANATWTINAGTRLTLPARQTPNLTALTLGGTLALGQQGNTFQALTLNSGAGLELATDGSTPALTVTNLTANANAQINLAVTGISITGLPADGKKVIAWGNTTPPPALKWVLPGDLVSTGLSCLQKNDGLYLVPFGGGSGLNTLTWPRDSAGGDWNAPNAWRFFTDESHQTSWTNYSPVVLQDLAAPAATLSITNSQIGAFLSANTATAYTITAPAGQFITFTREFIKTGAGALTVKAHIYPGTSIDLQGGTLTLESPTLGITADSASLGIPIAIATNATLSLTGLNSQTFTVPQSITGTGTLRFDRSSAFLNGALGMASPVALGAGTALTIAPSTLGIGGALPGHPFLLEAGSTLNLGTTNTIGNIASSGATLFARVENGAKIVKTAEFAETSGRPIELRGGILQNDATQNTWDFRSGTKITLAAGYESHLSGASASAGFRFNRDGSSNFDFDIGANATLKINARLTATGTNAAALQKTGPGTLAITETAAATHVINTLVNEGVFSLDTEHSGIANITYTVANSGLLRGNGILSNTNSTVEVNGTIAGGSHALTPLSGKTLTLAGTLALNEGSIIRVDNFAIDPDFFEPSLITMVGSAPVYLRGLVVVRINAPVPATANREKSYRLMTWSQLPLNSAYITLNAPAWEDAGYMITVKKEGVFLETFGGSDRLLRWAADHTAAWYAQTGSWVDANTSAGTYFDASPAATSVNFPDQPETPAEEVNLESRRPSVLSTLFSNTATDYTLTGGQAARLIITGDLRKNGTGRATVNPRVLGPNTVFINAGALHLASGLAMDSNDSFTASYTKPIYINTGARLAIGVGSGLQQDLVRLFGGGTLEKTGLGTLTVADTLPPALSGVTVSGGTCKASMPTFTTYPAVTVESGATFDLGQTLADAQASAKTYTVAISGPGTFVYRTNVTGGGNTFLSPGTITTGAFVKRGNGILVFKADTFATGALPDLWLADANGTANGIALDSTIAAATPLRVRNLGTLPGQKGFLRGGSTGSGASPVIADLTHDCTFEGTIASGSGKYPTLTLGTSTPGRKTFTLKGTSTPGAASTLTADPFIDLRVTEGGWTQGSVLVNAGASLSGTGTVSNASIESGALLAAGLDGSGTLTLTGTATLKGGSTLEIAVTARNTCSTLAAATCAVPSGKVTVRVVNSHGYYLQRTRIASWTAGPALSAFQLEEGSDALYTLSLEQSGEPAGLYLTRKPRQMWIMTR